MTVAGSNSATISSVDDLEPVGQADQLVEVGRDEQHREPGRAGGPQVVPDGRLGADVDAPGRVGGDEQLRLTAHLPAHDELLLVAARQGGGEDVDPGRAHVVVADDALGVGAGALAVDPPAPDVDLLGHVAEDPVLPEGCLQEQAVAVPVFGDVADRRRRGGAASSSR